METPHTTGRHTAATFPTDAEHEQNDYDQTVGEVLAALEHLTPPEAIDVLVDVLRGLRAEVAQFKNDEFMTTYFSVNT